MIAVCMIFALVQLSGCGVECAAIDPVGYETVKQGEENTEEDATQIVDGKTTKKEIFLIFGEPSSILQDGQVFVYDWIRGGEGNVLGFGGGGATTQSLVVTFDTDDVATGHRITRGKPTHLTPIVSPNATLFSQSIIRLRSA